MPDHSVFTRRVGVRISAKEASAIDRAGGLETRSLSWSTRGKRSHFRSPVEPKRSVLILSRSLPEVLRRSVALSTNDVGPQT